MSEASRNAPPLKVPGYVVGERLGAGGFGEVFRARHKVIGRDVAVKVLHAKYTEDEEAVARFTAEARAASQIDHPGIVEVLDFGQLADGRHYCVMELVRGKTLREVLRERGRLPLAEAVPVLRGIAAALDAAHAAGIAHRDLKPDNVFVLDGGGVKLIDFGLAKLTLDQSAPVTRTGTVFGTPLYMSPEQCRGKVIDTRTDLYSFGALAYQVLAGRPPFEGEALELALHHLNDTPARPSRHAPELPARVDRVVLALLAKEPRARPSPLVGAVDALAGVTAFRPGRRLVPLIVGGLAVAAAAALGLAHLARPREVAAPAPVACPPGASRMAGAWTEQRRAELEGKYRAFRRADTDTAVASLARDLDDYARRWVKQWDEACVAPDRETDPLLFAQRQNCLERTFVDFNGIVASVFDVEPVTFASSYNGALFLWSLPLEDCRSVPILRALPVAPPGEHREEVAQIVKTMQRARAESRAAQLRADRDASVTARAKFEAATVRLDELGVATAAQAAFFHAYYSNVASTPVERVASITRARELARKYRDELMLQQAELLSASLEIEARRDITAAEASLVRAGEAAQRGGRPVERTLQHAQVELWRRDHERALAIAAELSRAQPGHKELTDVANALFRRDGRFTDAIAIARRSLEDSIATWGGDQRWVVMAHDTLAMTLFWSGDATGALDQARAALAMAKRLSSKADPDTQLVAIWSAHQLGALAQRDEVAREYVAAEDWRSLSTWSAARCQWDVAAWAAGQLSPPESTQVLDDIAYASGNLSAISAGAAPWLRALVAPQEADAFLGRPHKHGADDIDDGIVLLEHRRWKEARVALERVVDPGQLDNQLEAFLGIALVETGDAAAAIPRLEAFLFENARRGHVEEFLVGHASFALARALAATGGDRARARRLGELAQRRLTQHQQRARDAVTAWLAAMPP